MSDRLVQSRNTIAIVPVRAGSKGFPGKNTALIAGQPLYLRAVQQGLRLAGQCILTTDIPEILEADPIPGCEVVHRPPQLARDETPIDPVISHALETANRHDGTGILLQATSPLRIDEDIRNGLAHFSDGDFELVMSVTAADPVILKFGMLDGNRFVPVSRPEYCFRNRQALPEIFRPNGAVYIFGIAGFLRRGALACNSIGAFEMPPERSVDIDSAEDLARAEFSLLPGREDE